MKAYLKILVSDNLDNENYEIMKDYLIDNFPKDRVKYQVFTDENLDFLVPKATVDPLVLFIMASSEHYDRIKYIPQIGKCQKVLTTDKNVFEQLNTLFKLVSLKNADYFTQKKIEKGMRELVNKDDVETIPVNQEKKEEPKPEDEKKIDKEKDVLNLPDKEVWKTQDLRQTFKMDKLVKCFSENLHISFSGSYQSIQKSYFALKNDIMVNAQYSNSDILFLDLSNESYAPYELKIFDPKEGYKWLQNPQNKRLKHYVDKTNINRVYYMSPFKGSFFNNAWLLTVDWIKVFEIALQEFQDVYVYFGSIVDSFNRGMISMLSESTEITVYQSGDYLSVVSMLNNLPTISDSKKIIIKMFDLSKYDNKEPNENKRLYAKQANDKYKIVRSRYPKTEFIDYKA